MRVGIIGAGGIARKAALTLADKPHGCYMHAVASRSLDKAQAFAAENGVEVAYGSYEELVLDPNVDLVYIATPHSHHYQHARLAVEHGKPCLVEKAFCANAQQASELLALAREKGVFVTEAMWTRYMPLSLKIGELIRAGKIGEPKALSASLCYPISHKERILRPELCGGALLDLGVYVLNFARMYLGTDIVSTSSTCVMGETGVDMQESMSLLYRNGAIASLLASALCPSDKNGIIRGEKGYVWVDNVNCPMVVEVYVDNVLTERYTAEQLSMPGYEHPFITGYEYQYFECDRCLKAGLTESPLMPHAETIAIMSETDSFLSEWHKA